MGGNVVFTQIVKARAGSNGIILGRPVDLEFTCAYQSEFETDSERITINEVTSVQGLSGDGDFSFAIELYSDHSFTEKQSESDVIIVGEMVYFSIETQQLPSNLVFAVHNCTIHDASVNEEYQVIAQSCPSPTIMASTQMASNSQLQCPTCPSPSSAPTPWNTRKNSPARSKFVKPAIPIPTAPLLKPIAKNANG